MHRLERLLPVLGESFHSREKDRSGKRISSVGEIFRIGFATSPSKKTKENTNGNEESVDPQFRELDFLGD